MTSARFELVQTDGSPLLIELRGEIDSTNAAAFDQALAEVVNSGPVILDLSAVAYFDSAGFEVLNRALSAGCLIVVVSPTGIIRRAASLMSVPFHDTIDQARAATSADHHSFHTRA